MLVRWIPCWHIQEALSVSKRVRCTTSYGCRAELAGMHDRKIVGMPPTPARSAANREHVCSDRVARRRACRGRCSLAVRVPQRDPPQCSLASRPATTPTCIQIRNDLLACLVTTVSLRGDWRGADMVLVCGNAG